MIVLWTVLLFAVSVAHKFGTKKLQTIFPSGQAAYSFYALITGVVSSVVYYVMTGCNLIINPRLIVFSLLFSVVCRISYVVTFQSLEHNGVFLYDLFMRVGSIIPPMIISALVLNENQSMGTLLGGILVILAALLPGMEFRKFSKKGIVAALNTILIATLTVMATKLLVLAEGSDAVLSYTFFTNVFISITSVFSFGKNCLKSEGLSIRRVFRKEHYFMIFVVILASNLVGYFAAILIAEVGVIAQTIISNSLGMLVTILVSLYFKEKLSIKHYISAVLSVISTILPIVLI